MRFASIALIVVVAGIVSAAWAQSTLPPPNPEAGHALAMRWCMDCHIIAEGQKRAVDSAPSFVDLARDGALSHEALRAFLSAPQHPMPPLELARVQINDLIAYIDTLRPAD